jgi:vancomycin permeability regulator SanA
MRIYASNYLYADLSEVRHVQFVVVPGASVIHGEPSPILALRADLGGILYKQHVAEKILITGDNAYKEYDEVTPIAKYLQASGVPASDMVLDRAGYNTYTSLYRAKHIFDARSLIVVSQDFHLPRSIFIARGIGIDAYGLSTTQGGKFFDYLREIPASWKALWDVMTDTIPQAINVNGPFSAPAAVARN